MTQVLEPPPQAAPNGNGDSQKQLAKRERPVIVVQDDSQFANLLDTGKFDHLWRLSQLFARSHLVPSHFHGKPEDCFVATQMAIRLGVDPFMFMQATFVYQGKPGMEGKLAIALINTSGLFAEPLEFEFSGTGDDYGCRAVATLKSSGKRVEGPRVTLKLAKEEKWYGRNEKWRTMTDMMLTYRAGAWFGRTKCPERLMGMQTIEELQDLGEAKPVAARVRDESRHAGKLAARLTQRPVSEGQTLETDDGQTIIEGEQPAESEKSPEQQLASHNFDAPAAEPTEPQEPDTSGSQAEPPPPSEMTPRDKWYAQIEEVAQAANIADFPKVRNIIEGWALKKGIKGREDKAKPEDVKVLLESLANKRGIFAGL